MDWIERMLLRPSRAELESQNGELQSQNDELESRNDELESRIAELESGIGERDAALDERDVENDHLRTRLAASADDENGLRGVLGLEGEKLVELLQRALADDVEGRVDFLQLEESLLKGSHKLSTALLRKTLERMEAVRKSFEGTCPRCSGKLRYERRHKRQILSRVGFLEAKFNAWRCDGCGFRIRPRERELGVDGGRQSTRGMQCSIGEMAAECTFAGGSRLIERFSGVRVSSKRLERDAKMLGAEVAADEEEWVEVAPAKPSSTACLAVDGTGVPMRPAETEGRRGKAEDGLARTREAKLAVGWVKDEDDRESVCYSAAVESASQPDGSPTITAPFWKRVERMATRMGFEDAGKQVFLGDGAAWIWKMAEEMFPQAIQVLDVFHALEKISGVAADNFKEEKERAHEFRLLKVWLKRGKLDAVLKRLSNMQNAKATIRYLENNRSRMDYPRCRREGLPCCSSRVESACKNVVGARMKRGGMRWTVNGANAILALRCCIASGRLDGYFDRVREAVARELRAFTANPVDGGAPA